MYGNCDKYISVRACMHLCCKLTVIAQKITVIYQSATVKTYTEYLCAWQKLQVVKKFVQLTSPVNMKNTLDG